MSKTDSRTKFERTLATCWRIRLAFRSDSGPRGVVCSLLAVYRRTHPCAATFTRRLRAIHRLVSANSVTTCAVFLASPR